MKKIKKTKDGKETYAVDVRCRNCKWRGEERLEKGIRVESLDTRDCPNCGCQELNTLGVRTRNPYLADYGMNGRTAVG